MARTRSPDRDRAFEVYKQHDGKIDLIEIARELNLPSGTIRGWKNKDKWEQQLNGTLQKDTERSKKKKGGQPNNKNAVGHGAPQANKNAEKHGLFAKYLPEETLELIKSIETRSPIDLLWDQIMIQYAAIIRSQQIMEVTGKDEMIKELKRSKVKTNNKQTSKTNSQSSEEEYEYAFQFAWDRQATFLKAQSRALGELRSMLKQFVEMANYDDTRMLEAEKMRAIIDRTKADTEKIKAETKNEEEGSSRVVIVNNKEAMRKAMMHHDKDS